MQIAKTFMNNKLELKFNVQNLLAQDLIYFQNNEYDIADKVSGITAFFNSVLMGDPQDKNGFDASEDDVVWRTKFGPTFSLSLNYNF